MGPSQGSIEIGRERKRVMEWRHSEIGVCYLAAHPKDPQPFSEISTLTVSCGSRTVLKVRWDDDGVFQIVCFKPGQWESELRTRALNASHPRASIAAKQL
ncbi:hypothetical protein [Afipia broomeae]|uniref:Uncharacterized protein n=1 Tax=Afipia broomeae ATCC 49717 TaxID=883078 RepID=K8P7I3_9BRAD|nr:hypothetical protein [Afipia broomeae]EKS34338.1 hypothetical protein HMPREF9695_04248 [Afipia broomeae ATCC 49717]